MEKLDFSYLMSRSIAIFDSDILDVLLGRNSVFIVCVFKYCLCSPIELSQME